MSNDDPLIRRYASGCLNNIATHRLKITQMSDEALAAVKLRVETKEIEERRSRYAMDTIALAVRAMPLAARERRVAMAKRRLASALRRRRWLASSAPQRVGRVVALVQLLCECLHVRFVRQRRIDAIGEHASPREAGIRPEPLIDDGAWPRSRVSLETAFGLFLRSLKRACQLKGKGL